MPTSPCSPRPSRIASILIHKRELARNAGNRVAIARAREAILNKEYQLQQPALPEEGVGSHAVIEADGLLRDTHERYVRCSASVKDAVIQAQRIDAMTHDASVRLETRANLQELRENLLELEHDRMHAERVLRDLPGYVENSCVLATLLEAQRELEKLQEEYKELEAEHALAVDTLRSYGNHTQLSLSKRIPAPSIPLADDGRRCEMCNTGFPAREVETTPCGHFYHIFCLAIRVAMYPECCHVGCRVPFPQCWLQNYGFPSQSS